MRAVMPPRGRLAGIHDALHGLFAYRRVDARGVSIALRRLLWTEDEDEVLVERVDLDVQLRSR